MIMQRLSRTPKRLLRTDRCVNSNREKNAYEFPFLFVISYFYPLSKSGSMHFNLNKLDAVKSALCTSCYILFFKWLNRSNCPWEMMLPASCWLEWDKPCSQVDCFLKLQFVLNMLYQRSVVTSDNFHDLRQ